MICLRRTSNVTASTLGSARRR